MATVFREFYVTIANSISRYWKRQRFKLANILTIYKDAQVNEFFWCSCLLGGILKTKKVPRIIKRIWLVCDISLITIMLTLNVVCLVWYEEKNRTTFRKFSRPVFAIAMLCSGQEIFRRYMDLIENYTNNMDKRIESMSFDENALKCSGKMSMFEIFVSVCACLFFTTGLLTKYFLPDFEILNGVFSSYYPFNDNFQNYPTAILAIILFLEFLTTMPICFGIYFMLKLMKLFIALMKRTFDFYLQQIAYIGSTTLQQMESSHNDELLMEQNEESGRYRSPEEFIRQRNAIENNFEKEMAYTSKQIWSLIRYQKTLQKMFENACTSSLFALYAIAIPLAGQLLWVIHNPSQITVPLLHAMIFFPLNVYLFYKLCHVGTQISNILEQFPIEVYSTPWYMMSKKTRRTIHIFLAQTQYEHRLRILKTVPIDVCLFYQFMDSLYSNGSVFHSIVEKSK